jgi:hypothetical protein
MVAPERDLKQIVEGFSGGGCKSVGFEWFFKSYQTMVTVPASSLKPAVLSGAVPML